MKQKSFLNFAIVQSGRITPTHSTLKKLMKTEDTRPEIIPPYHDYYKVFQSKKDAASASKCAEIINMNYQYEIVNKIFTSIYKDEKNPIREGRLETETEETMELLIDRYELVDIRAYSKKMLNYFKFHLVFRCYERSMKGVEYALVVDILVKDQPFKYIIESCGFEEVEA